MSTPNRRAVTTDIKKALATNIVDINKTVAIISDVATIGTAKKLYTSLEDVLLDWLVTDEFYLMAKAYFDEGGTQLYAVPLADVAGNADIVTKLGDLENDPDANFSFVTVITDKVIGVADQAIDGTLIAYVFNREYHTFIETSVADTLTALTTDPASVNKAYYDALAGDDVLRIGNFTMAYTDVATDYPLSGVVGKLMSLDIGLQTVKFMKPQNSGAIEITNSELTNVLNKQVAIYTGTGERPGRSFIKEGITLKDGDYIDTSLGAIWIKVQLDNALYDLAQTVRIPVNNDGFTLCENQVSAVFEQAVAQGIIDGNADVPFSISFSAGDLGIREIIGTYEYVGSLAGHFITNTVTITQGS